MEFSLNELSKIADQIIADATNRASADHATIVAFSGDLGAGKTTMIKEIAKSLGVQQDLASPTYVIYKVYNLDQGRSPFKKLIHGDMYRLESSGEIMQLGWEQLIADPENLILVEWPEKIADVIPDWAGRVTLNHAGADTRTLDIK